MRTRASRPATSRCSCRTHRTARPGPRRARRGRRPGRDQRRRQRVRAPAARATGCGCSRRSSARRGRAARHAAALTPLPRLERRAAWRARRTRTWEERPRAGCTTGRALLRPRGVASLAETITLGRAAARRACSARPTGERALTDLRHVGQLLHAAATAEQLGATALTAWLRRRIADGRAGRGDEERSRRLESDAEAVQVLTIHRSKGLEFPIVYLPVPVGAGAGSPRGRARRLPRPRRGRPADDRRRPRRRRVRARTRASTSTSSAARTCGSPTSRSPARATRRSCGGRGSYAKPRTRRSAGCCSRATSDGNVRGDGRRDARATPTVVARFEELAAAAPAAASASSASSSAPADRWARRRCPSRRARRPRRSTASSTALAADLLQRHHGGAYERRRRRERAAPSRASAASRRTTALVDEPTSRRAAAATRPVAARRRAARAAVAAGGDAGGRARRHVRPPRARGDRLRRARPRRRARAQLAARGAAPLDVGDAAASSPGCAAAIETPLGPLVGDLRLRDVARADRLDELDFELPLAGGDDADRASSTLAAIAGRAAAHLRPATRCAGYAERLADPALRQSVRGYLTGSLDLVVRLRRTAGALRRRRLQDQLARRAGRGADAPGTTARGARRGDAARALRAAGAALHGRAAPLPALAAAGLRPRRATSPACSTCSCAG